MSETSLLPNSVSCLIIGAGLSGCAAARKLEGAGLSCLVLDKGRGVGGRMATRRMTDQEGRTAYLDHGAQFITVRDPEFKALVNQWQTQGLIAPWCIGFPTAGETEPADGHPRYRGTRGMNALAKHLATGLTIRLKEEVSRIEALPIGWHVTCTSGFQVNTRRLLLTAPVPQSLDLLDAGNVELPSAERSALEAIEYDPCLAVLARLSEPSKLDMPGGLHFAYGPLAWLADNQKKGISPEVPAVTIHADAEFSREAIDGNREAAARVLVGHATPWIGAPIAEWSVHGWRYSIPTTMHPQRSLMIETDSGILAFAGDAFDGPRVEGAIRSGWQAAEDILGRRGQA